MNRKPNGWKGPWPPDRSGRKWKHQKVDKELEDTDEKWIEDEVSEYENPEDLQSPIPR